jgi:tetratricopeptide (TPR) repeat protein
VAWNGKGKVLYLAGKYEDALTAFNRAIEIKPKVAGYWYYKSLALKSLHQDAEAEAALSKAKVLGYKAPSTN